MIPDPATARETIERILSRPEFREPGVDLTWIEDLRRRIVDALAGLFSLGTSLLPSEYAQVQAILLAIVLAMVALFLLRLALGRNEAGARAAAARAAHPATIADPLAGEDPERFLARGDAVGAVRAAFALLLARLGARVGEDLAPCTPREVLLRAGRWKIAAPARDALAPLARNYARVRYAGWTPPPGEARNFLDAARDAARAL